MEIRNFINLSESGRVTAVEVMTQNMIAQLLESCSTMGELGAVEDAVKEKNRRAATSQRMPSAAQENAREAIMRATAALARSRAILRGVS
ncbi:MAG: hypothetical protein A2Z31_01220 [candidate division NC10 bacterium RBG_16_65_8]|nr:MAG: hypothetical protein A2Z31_01220 [candidate division NC10 bacterium RBG_16_65_8]